ncbi:SUMF1/EgtB/PvdO family nonheme iron enzyme [Novosphingobium album (ex Liu et al. 2023)]|uniref:SUMF1/EgtB/PvdO family nonheme iron enzyme n=1 Tax=Novosphingobium album (ex Liu et al. 2023) TaxID=3031130 RepID=A0ABT5WQC9_9SPHN|nr:SUMF1/EgtB/PvdO family nonheme iron enzyme [Novosphingobium album (ex Liu et al. 2023)]MDE8651492.1 SUMF1/EgtB/PvdO family nonheme iron enzyme [Novosphingobium album (ex Liu et al. 2023)]
MDRPRLSPRRRWRLALAPVAVLALGGAGGQPSTPRDRCLSGDGRVRVPAGIVLLGEDGLDRPGRAVAVPGFWIDRHEVTNRQFAAFVAATGYRTQAEREGASAVFVQPTESVPLDNAARWWRFVSGADWRHPRGPGSGLAGRDDDPVVQVDRADAAAYARWAGGALPSEAQWERAARGNQKDAVDPASWAFDGAGKPRANVWEGVFPVRDTAEDGFAGIAPVGCFQPNDFGVYDMVGNVWEWTAGEGAVGLVKGGSHLCAMNYCANFRPAAFQAQEENLGTSHIGFRVAYRAAR